MNTPRRLRFSAALFGAATLAASALTLLPGAARAQTAVTDPVGYLSIALPANSDTFVSIPFTRPAEFTGAVASVDNATSKITLSGTPGFTAGSFAALATTAPNDGHKTYYAIIGPKNAALTPTLSVTPGSATVTASTATPEAVAGDTITVAGYTFTVVSVSGATLTIDRVYPGTTAASGLAATYDHSPSEGRFYTVTANDAGNLTVNLNGDSLSNVAAGTQVSVIPYWTLGTAFPASNAVAYGATSGAGKSFMASNGNKARGTQIFIPNLTGRGTNLAPSLNYFFNSGAWRSGTDFVNPYDDTVLLPDAYLITRNPSNAPTDLTFSPTGSVYVNRLASPLTVYGTTKQDNSAALTRPTAVALNDLGLITSGAFQASPSAKNQADQLLVLDNSTTGINRTASRIYYYQQGQGGGWRRIDTGTQDVGTDTISAATGFIVRKAAPGVTDPNYSATSFLQNGRNYLN